MIKGFKTLYGHQEGRKLNINNTINIIYKILEILNLNSHRVYGDR